MLRLIILLVVGWLAWRWLDRRLGISRPPQSGSKETLALDPWSLLGVDPGAEPDQIRRAFHERMAQYHPDKVRELGPEIRDVAERKSRELTWAYEELQRARSGQRPR